MPTIEGIIARGYLPKELPPAFTSNLCGSVLARKPSVLPSDFARGGRQSKCMSHNLLMRGSLRRRLGVPNPIHFFRLAGFVVDNWPSLISIATESDMSVTAPLWQDDGRAIGRSRNEVFRDSDSRRARIRSKSRYVLKADINQFYHSIYTHSIAWAMHGKDTAKARREPTALLGNTLDRLIRDSQDGQSTGIPIGPDTSLLIAEMMLSAIDIELFREGIENAFRIIDDYEFGCESLSEAEQTREILQKVLYDYRLVLNCDKTHIIELPVAIDSLPVSQLRVFEFSIGSPVSEGRQRSEIVHYFDQAFAFSRQYPDDAVLRYAVARLNGISVLEANWSLFQDLLLQCVIVEPSTLEFALNQLVRYRDGGYSLDLDHITDVLNRVVARHAPLGHGSEVAWALWGSLVLGTVIGDDSAGRSANTSDSIVAILLLDARDKGLVSSSIDVSHIQSCMTSDELYGDQWLTAYEASVKGWLPSLDKSDHVSQDDRFAFLKSEGVCFYDDGASGRMAYKPPRLPPGDEGY